MISLKFAAAFVDLTLEKKKYDSDLAKVQKDLAAFPGKLTVALSVNATQFRKDMVAIRQELSKIGKFQIQVTMDRGKAAAAMSLLRQQLQSLQGRNGSIIRFNADLVQWRRSIVQVFTDLNRVKAFASTIPIKVNATAAHANVNLLMQQLRTAQTLAKFQVTGIGRGGLGRGGGGGGRGGIGNFVQGLGMGAGMSYTNSPQMMAGQLLSKGIIETVKTTADLESQFIELRRITGMTADQMTAFQKSLFDLAQTQPGVSMDDLIGMSQIGGRAGVADKEGAAGLLTFTGDLAKVRNVITDIPAEELAESIAKVLNVFGEGTDRVASFGSALAKMDTISVASARDILQISREFSGTAKSLQMTIPQVLAFASVLKDVGLSNAQASGSYNQIFRVMASSHEKIADLIGVEGAAFKKAYEVDAMGALDMVLAKLKTIESTVEAQEFLKSLGFKGVRSGAAISQLSSMNAQVRTRATIASRETGTLETLNTANALKGGTANNQFTRAGNAIKDLTSAAGEKLAPAARGAAWGLSEVASGLASIIRGTNQVSFAGGPPSKAKVVLGAMPDRNPNGAPVLTLADAKAAEDAAQMKATEAQFNVDATTAEARRLGFEARQSMAGAAATGNPADLAAANALSLRSFAAENAAKVAADALAKSLAELQKAIAKTTEKETEKLAADAKVASGERLNNALRAPGRLIGGMMAAGAAGNELFGSVVGAVPKLAKMLPEKKQQSFSSGLSGEEIGRRIQQDILNMTKDKSGEEVAKNTRTANAILSEVRDILKRGGQGIGAAVLGQ